MSIMTTSIDVSESEQTLRRLKSEYVAASKRAITALNEHGLNSEPFRVADREVQALKRRIDAIARYSGAS
jgi:hypothetical protein